jgi:hypothetical protein
MYSVSKEIQRLVTFVFASDSGDDSWFYADAMEGAPEDAQGTVQQL